MGIIFITHDLKLLRGFADNVVVAGDAASGASLVVRALASGRQAARKVQTMLG